MGLSGWLTGLLDGDGGADGDGDEGDLDLLVDVERRAGSIFEQYDLASDDARRVAEILAAEVTREDGYSRTMIADRIAREVDVSEDRARTIVNTEVASIRNLARVRKFARQAEGDVRFRWVDSVGRDDSPVCATIRETIDEQGPVTFEELQTLIEDAASDHESGTPERADDLIPHESCRHTVVQHFEG